MKIYTKKSFENKKLKLEMLRVLFSFLTFIGSFIIAFLTYSIFEDKNAKLELSKERLELQKEKLNYEINEFILEKNELYQINRNLEDKNKNDSIVLISTKKQITQQNNKINELQTFYNTTSNQLVKQKKELLNFIKKIDSINSLKSNLYIELEKFNNDLFNLGNNSDGYSSLGINNGKEIIYSEFDKIIRNTFPINSITYDEVDSLIKEIIANIKISNISNNERKKVNLWGIIDILESMDNFDEDNQDEIFAFIEKFDKENKSELDFKTKNINTINLFRNHFLRISNKYFKDEINKLH